jgi:hypothetical protein
MKKTRFIFIVFLLGLAGMPIPSFAVEVANLFAATVNVSTQRESERKSAMAEGFSQVLLRVSGSQRIMEEPTIVEALNNAQTYVLGFSYAKPQEGVTLGSDSQAVFNYSLKLKFDARAITNLLREAQLPVWGKNRPPLMVWWVFDDGEREIINMESAPDLQAVFSQQASLRGLPLVFPLLDLQDNASLETRDIWGFFFDKVKQASVRYGSQNILVGRTFIQGDKSESRWVLLSENEIFWAEKKIGQVIDVLPESVNFAADNLAERYAVSSILGNGALLPIAIYGVNNLQQFAELERFFQAMDIVENVSLASIQNDRVIFTLSLRTELARFQKAINKSRKFSEEPLPEDEAEILMHYRLLDY